VTRLIGFAAKHTPDGGRIEVRASSAGGMIQLSIRDDDAAFSAAELRGIQELFLTGRRLDGSPAHDDLAIVHQIVVEHGGSITAFSGGVSDGCEIIVQLSVAED
jgi:signal transduction histidine kinase